MGLTRVGGEKPRSSFFPMGWNVAAKPCDYCKSAAALLFCSADSAFMCIKCDAKVHNADGQIAHAKVWMCEVCEQAPAAVTCKADAASLCITCDCDIHSVNPLAQRHDRVAVVPFYNTAESTVLKSTAVFDAPASDSIADWKLQGYFPDSWSSTKLAAEMNSMEFLFPNSNQFLDFDSYRICSQPYSDSVVPVQTTVKQPPPSAQLPENRFEIDFTKSDITSYSHSVSSSSTDVGLVPDGSETSYPLTVSSITDPIANHGMDRKARVLRYREKRKNRKFDKTIRYVSRKAYAEVRPRIKGRFAKRTDSDGMLGFDSGKLIGDPSYGVVPSF